MDLEARKITFLDKFMSLQNSDIVSQFENLLLKLKRSDSNDEFESMSKDELNKRIEKSMDDSKNGRLTESSVLKAEIKTWS
ncbi:MAG: hypothetical protein U9N85_13900 [Bacteroidota bacterium]|nr:hypothetical protein [Bacteroidota bacterium]